ncbi:MAG: AAA family ATPase [Verrucomicrobiales bacterium]|nr:AAA family ATPase [Verrucomicrobiales bacterium]
MNIESIKAAAERLRDEVTGPMKASFVGKDEIIDLLSVCVAARENLFLHGPPGTAKSALVHSFAGKIQGRTFDYLLSRFTEPNELFGPFDIRKLREGDLVTNTEGMLPEADIVFLDELLNANSAILNSLLMALNERVFRRGRETRQIPALFFVGASNHLPEDEALGALFDRFLLRVRCGPVPDEQLGEVLTAGWNLEKAAQIESTMQADDLRTFQNAIREVDLEPTREAYIDLVKKLRLAGIEVSDRRAVRLQRVVAASALVSGRLEARISDLWIFRHIWDREEQVEVIESIVSSALQQAEPQEGDHDQAFKQSAPDPEALLLGLEQIEAMINAGENGLAAADELRSLSSRIEWLPDAPGKIALETKRNELWEKLEQN